MVNVIGNLVGTGPRSTVFLGAATEFDIMLYSSGIELKEVIFKISTAA